MTTSFYLEDKGCTEFELYYMQKGVGFKLFNLNLE